MVEIDGVVKIEDGKHKREVTVINSETQEEKVYHISFGVPILFKTGDEVKAGNLLTDGSINPQDIMRILGAEAVQNYIISEVIKVYNNNGVEINDKHIEIITRQMMRKVRVDDPATQHF